MFETICSIKCRSEKNSPSAVNRQQNDHGERWATPVRCKKKTPRRINDYDQTSSNIIASCCHWSPSTITTNTFTQHVEIPIVQHVWFNKPFEWKRCTHFIPHMTWHLAKPQAQRSNHDAAFRNIEISRNVRHACRILMPTFRVQNVCFWTCRRAGMFPREKICLFIVSIRKINVNAANVRTKCSPTRIPISCDAGNVFGPDAVKSFSELHGVRIMFVGAPLFGFLHPWEDRPVHNTISQSERWFRECSNDMWPETYTKFPSRLLMLPAGGALHHFPNTNSTIHLSPRPPWPTVGFVQPFDAKCYENAHVQTPHLYNKTATHLAKSKNKLHNVETTTGETRHLNFCGFATFVAFLPPAPNCHYHGKLRYEPIPNNSGSPNGLEQQTVCGNNRVAIVDCKFKTKHIVEHQYITWRRNIRPTWPNLRLTHHVLGSLVCTNQPPWNKMVDLVKSKNKLQIAEQSTIETRCPHICVCNVGCRFTTGAGISFPDKTQRFAPTPKNHRTHKRPKATNR